MVDQWRLEWIAYGFGAAMSAAGCGVIVVTRGVGFTSLLFLLAFGAAFAYSTLRTRDVWLTGHGVSPSEIAKHDEYRNELVDEIGDLQKHCRDCGEEVTPDGCIQSTPAGPVYYCSNCCPRCRPEERTSPSLPPKEAAH